MPPKPDSKPSEDSEHSKLKTPRPSKTPQSQLFRYFVLFPISLALAAYGVFIVLSQPHTVSEFSDIDPLYDPAIVRDGTMFQVLDMPGKGKGAIAVRNIKQGELIVREAPVILVPSTISSSPQEYISRTLDQLSASQRSAFFNLSYVNFPQHLDPSIALDSVALAIAQTNGVAAGQNVGVFPRMARFNHGCSSAFNAVYSWRPEGILVVHALKDIKQGDEILTVYLDTKKPKAERRPILLEHYGFECACAVCSLPPTQSAASDERLGQIASHYSSFGTWGNDKIDGRQAMILVRRIWDLEEEEGYWSERGRLAADACWVASAHSDDQAAREWAQLSIRWYGIELGLDSREVGEMRGILEHPERHNAWATKTPMVVGGPGRVPR